MPWQINYVLLRIGFAMRAADIFLNLVLRRKPLIRIHISGIGNKRHLCHFGNGDGRKMVIYLHRSQKQVASATLKRMLGKAVREMRRIKISSLMIDPGPEIHIAPFGGHLFGRDQIGQHADLPFMVFQKVAYLSSLRLCSPNMLSIVFFEWSAKGNKFVPYIRLVPMGKNQVISNT